jgi:hypothetical protein
LDIRPDIGFRVLKKPDIRLIGRYPITNKKSKFSKIKLFLNPTGPGTGSSSKTK